MWAGTSSSNPASPTTPQIPSTTTSAPSYKLKHQGRRFAQIVKLKPECVEKYKECHAKVWPEVLKQIKECNIEDCEFGLFLFNRPVGGFDSCLSWEDLIREEED
jgi:hypothetical protein